MLQDILVIDSETDTQVYSFTEQPQNIPESDDTVWVPDNGDVAYYVNGREFDYENGEVRLLCNRSPEVSKE